MSIEYSYESSSQVLHVKLSEIIYVQDVLNHLNEVIEDKSINDVKVEIVNFENVKDFALAQDEAVSIRTEFAKFRLDKSLIASIIIACSPFHQGMAKMMESIIGHNIQMHIVDTHEQAVSLASNLLEKETSIR